ncbi:MAG: NAD(P)-dependent oxidoreductase [Chloroflexota bacterium]
MRVAVTGAGGRLGRALIEALEAAPFTGTRGPIAWSRPELDLDTLTVDSVLALIERDRPELVIHAAAWTDVDGCAKDPALAMRRNAEATRQIASACAGYSVHLTLISTNEVFDGRRIDGRGYAPWDHREAINAYGASKLEAERLASGEMFDEEMVPFAIVRTSWLHGPPGNDFPEKLARAALRAKAAGEPLRVVGDEIGTPTYTPDVAEAIVELIAEDELCPYGELARYHHLVNGGRASRADWAREVLRATGIEVEVEEVPASTWQRASTPPLWAVLEPTPLPSGEPMRHWREAFADAVPALLRSLGPG